MSDEITGRIDSWVFQQVTEQEGVIIGYIYDDSKRRFEDGQLFHTSGVPIDFYKEGDVVETRNSTYLLGPPLEPFPGRTTKVEKVMAMVKLYPDYNEVKKQKEEDKDWRELGELPPAPEEGV